MDNKTKNSYKWMKIQIKTLKIIPMLLAFIYWINTILGYFGISQILLNYIAGTSLLPLSFLYISSYALGFCPYHRMFLHYIATSEITMYLIMMFGISISQYALLVLLMVIAGVFLGVILYQWLHLK